MKNARREEGQRGSGAGAEARPYEESVLGTGSEDVTLKVIGGPKMQGTYASDTAAIRRHLTNLCVKIGNRLAGTAGERRAAKYIEGCFSRYGLSTVHQEKFPCVAWSCRKVGLWVKDRKWRRIECIPLAHSRPTGGRIETELVYLETAMAQDFGRDDVKGKVGLMFGGFGNKPDKYVRLLKSGLAAIILVDDRYPFEWPVAMGTSRHWKRLGRQTGVTISYMDAWNLVRRKVKRVRIEIDTGTRSTHSCNVVGEVKGERKNSVIVVCAHHDSVYGNVGAEDDGSGVVCVLELARAFARSRPVHTLRFITFGTEEQLSEGSKHYVLGHRDEVKRIAFVLNTDSIGGWLGRNQVFAAGTRELLRFAKGIVEKAGFNAEVIGDISPFSDQFPFNMFGIPSLWFHRSNCPGGRWFHHSAHDTPAVLSEELLARTLQTQGLILDELCGRKRLPFPRKIPASQERRIESYKRTLYGL